jgi:hypothetical protein
MEGHQVESGLPDPSDVDWDAELEQLPRDVIMVDIAYRSARRLVSQWYELRAGDATGFDDMPAELGLEPDTKVGAVVVDAFTEAICAAIEVDRAELGEGQVAELTEAILGCLTQGVSIGLGAVPDNDQVEEPR